jgi:enoyl-CoA hydratase
MIPGWGGTFRLARYVGVARAKEMIYTGRMVPADEAQATGLVNGVFDDDALLESVLDIAKKIATNAPIATRLSKKMLNRHPWDLQTLVNEEALALAHCVNTEDQTEAIQAFLEKREPKFQNK